MYILFKDSKGEIHKVPEGVPYKKGQDWVEVGSEMDQREDELNGVIDKLAHMVGVTTDECISRLTKALGITKCPTCQIRSEILRRMGQLGFVETMRRLKATFRTAPKKDA